jgi:hypothetical protein
VAHAGRRASHGTSASPAAPTGPTAGCHTVANGARPASSTSTPGSATTPIAAATGAGATTITSVIGVRISPASGTANRLAIGDHGGSDWNQNAIGPSVPTVAPRLAANACAHHVSGVGVSGGIHRVSRGVTSNRPSIAP